MEPLNDEQVVILKEITVRKQTYRDVADTIGKSLRWVQIQLEVLESGGYIRKRTSKREKHPWISTAKGNKVLQQNGASHERVSIRS